MFWNAGLAARIVGGTLRALALLVRTGGDATVEIDPRGFVKVTSRLGGDAVLVDCTKDGVRA